MNHTPSARRRQVFRRSIPGREEAPGPENTSAFLRGSHDHAPARQIRIPTARGKGCCPGALLLQPARATLI